jgi:hypothetical protein
MARPRKNPLYLKKECPTCKKEFEISSRKYRQRFCSRTCANHHPEVLERMKQSQLETYNKNYGVDHPMQTDGVKENFKKSILKKYGVDHYSKTDEYEKKCKATKLKRYGSENYVNVEKIKNTCLKRYGVNNYRKTEEYKIKYKKTCLARYGLEQSSKSHEFSLAHKELMFNKFLTSDRFKNFSPQFNISEYNGVTKGFKKYPFKCMRCNEMGLHDISNGKDIFCDVCDEVKISKFQKEVRDFIRSIISNEEILEQNIRNIIHPKELDIYIPDKKIAIECNGLCWHSEVLGNKNKVYHLNKTKWCMSKGIFLIHIFESEWIQKKEIVKSILLNLLNSTPDRIYARVCKLREISSEESKIFLNNNHIQENDISSYKLGLFFEETLVSVMTFCKSRFDSKIQYEMSRFCNKINTNVIGGASKLFSHFINTLKPTSVVSYSDRRYFNGNLYKTLNFNFAYNTPPNYYYILDNYKTLQHRMNWQKHKLKTKLPNFDETLSEWENMKTHGFDRIWDCGHGKWIWEHKDQSSS